MNNKIIKNKYIQYKYNYGIFDNINDNISNKLLF